MKPNAYIDSILKTLPELPGVYRYYNSDGEIIYVGKAKNLKRRVNSYFNREHDSYKTTLLVRNIVDIKYSVVSSEQEAFLLENNFIKQHQPHYNILLKDGKSYPSICITKEPYPRVFKTRNRDKRLGEFFGPYSYSNTVDLVLELIHQLYPIRTCHLALTDESIRAGKHKVCLKYHLKNCCGICESLCTKATYDSYIDAARKIIKGDADVIGRQMMDQMRQLAEEMRFEEAQQIKAQYLLIEKFRSKTVISGLSVRDVDVFGYDEQDKTVYISMLRIHNGSIIQGQTIEYKRQMDETREEMLAYGIAELRVQLGATTSDILVPFMPEWTGEDLRFSSPSSGDRKKLLDLAMQNVRQYKSDRLKQADKLNPDQRVVRLLGELQKALKLNELPMWIDSFDNSNIQGTDAVAGCVVFKKAKPSKADYKRFKIKTVTGADDYASMREIVYRRYAHLIEDNAGLPNLIIADGGIGQMRAIREAVEKQLGLSIPIAGLVKDDHHRTSTLLFGDPPQEIGLKPTEELFRFLTQIQDEVHRFAIAFHIHKRSKSQTHSELDEIRGIGEKTKSMLLNRFGSVKRIREAKLAELVEIAGNSKGSIVYNHFNSNLSR